MFRETIKKYAGITLVVAVVMSVFCSCGNGNAEAKALLEQAQSKYDAGDYSGAISMLDSLKNTYPSAIDEQRCAMYFRTLADEQIVLLQMAVNDSVLAASESAIASLVENFTFIKDADMVEGYTVNNLTKKNQLVDRSGLEARIDERANLYVVSLLNGKKANHDRVEVIKGIEFATTETVPYNGSTNYRFNVGGVNNEMVTFRGGKTDTLCMFVADNRNSKLKLQFVGSKNVSMPLSAADTKAIAVTYDYAKALQANREADAQKKYLEAKLQITRQQKEKTVKYAKQ